MGQAMVSFSFNLPPEKNIEFLKAKKPKLSFNYDEVMHEAHLKAFSIAKVTKLDLLSDIQDSLLKAQSEGKSFEVWKKDIKPTLAKKGWLGKVEVTNEKTGEIKTINVNNTRLKRIYNTNMRTANAQGRAKAQYALEGEIYLRYIALQDGLTRPSHLRMHGITLKREDKFWETNYPPNGWNCRCVVRAYSKEECERQGFSVSQTPPLPIASKDWSYDKRGLNKDESLDSILQTKLEKFKKNPDKRAFVESLNDTKADIAQVKQNYQAIKNLKQESKNGEVDRKFIPLAKTTQTLKNLLKTEAKEIYLSAETLKDHLEKHPNVGVMDYSLLPLIIRDANVYRIKKSKENHIVYFSKAKNYYKAAIKTTEDKKEIFLLSLIKSSKKL